jgi:UDP-N-acetylglucosamine enolpyruvyl transferase
MDKLIIQGDSDLFGSIDIPGSKNASLPILVASLLSKKNLNLSHIPILPAVKSLLLLFRRFGVKINENYS